MSFFSIFFKKEREEYRKKIKYLENENMHLKENLENAKIRIEELDKMPKVPPNHTIIRPEQIAIYQKNIYDTKDEFKKYKFIIELYNLNHTSPLSKYKVDVSTFYPKNKFADLLEKLEADGINYVDDIKDFDINYLSANIKNSQEAYEKFTDFHKNIMTWEIRTILCKGEKIAKVFSKYRKFYTIMNNLKFEFMDEIIDFDMSKLKEYKYKENDILEFEKIREEYYRMNRTIIKD